jgi:hypothetical protein
MSCGILETRYAPFLMALLVIWDTPERFDRMDPASLAFSGSLNLRGGAKSRAVKVPDLRRT